MRSDAPVNSAQWALSITRLSPSARWGASGSGALAGEAHGQCVPSSAAPPTQPGPRGRAQPGRGPSHPAPHSLTPPELTGVTASPSRPLPRGSTPGQRSSADCPQSWARHQKHKLKQNLGRQQSDTVWLHGLHEERAEVCASPGAEDLAGEHLRGVKARHAAA